MHLVEFQECLTLSVYFQLCHMKLSCSLWVCSVWYLLNLYRIVWHVSNWDCCTTVYLVWWCLGYYLVIPGSHEWLNRASVGNSPPPRNTERAELSFPGAFSCSSEISWALNCNSWRWCSSSSPTNNSLGVSSCSETFTLF